MDKYFTFEVQVLDDKNIRRRFRASTFQVLPCVHVHGVDVLSSVCAPHGLAPTTPPLLPPQTLKTHQSCTRVKPFICTMPMSLDEGWNQIQFNLADFTRRAYGTNYVETLRVQVHANCRLRRIYFSDRLYSEVGHVAGESQRGKKGKERACAVLD